MNMSRQVSFTKEVKDQSVSNHNLKIRLELNGVENWAFVWKMRQVDLLIVQVLKGGICCNWPDLLLKCSRTSRIYYSSQAFIKTFDS